MTDLKDLKDYSYVQQIPLEALFKNMGYKQQQYDQAFQKAQQVVDMVGNIPSLGQDTQKKQEIMDNVNKELSKFAGQDLREGNVQSSLNGFIGQVLGGKDLQNMAARATKYTQDQKTYRELQKAGKSVPMWMQTSLNQAGKYYGSGVYDPEAKFTGEIQVAPDFTAKHKAMMDGLKPNQQMVLGKDGYYHFEKGVSDDRVAAEFYHNYQNDPELKEYYDKLFDATNENTPWEQHVNTIYDNHAAKIQHVIDVESALYQGDQDAAHLSKIQEYKKDMENLKAAKDSPNSVNFFKAVAKDDFLKQQAASDAAAKGWVESDIKINRYDEISAEQRKEINLVITREMAERGLISDGKGGWKPMTYTTSDGTEMEVDNVGHTTTGKSAKEAEDTERADVELIEKSFSNTRNQSNINTLVNLLKNKNPAAFGTANKAFFDSNGDLVLQSIEEDNTGQKHTTNIGLPLSKETITVMMVGSSQKAQQFLNKNQKGAVGATGIQNPNATTPPAAGVKIVRRK